MNAQGEHVRLSAAAGLVDGLRAREVRLSTLDGLMRDLQVFLRQRDAKVGLQHAQHNIRLAATRVFAGQLAGEARRLDAAAGLPSIEQHLLDRQPRLVVVQSVRAVQRANSEIPFAELVLGKQRCEHEDGVVATLEAFRELRARHIPRAGLLNASLRFLFSCVGGCHQRI